MQPCAQRRFETLMTTAEISIPAEYQQALMRLYFVNLTRFGRSALLDMIRPKTVRKMGAPASLSRVLGYLLKLFEVDKQGRLKRAHAKRFNNAAFYHLWRQEIINGAEVTRESVTRSLRILEEWEIITRDYVRLENNKTMLLIRLNPAILEELLWEAGDRKKGNLAGKQPRIRARGVLEIRVAAGIDEERKADGQPAPRRAGKLFVRTKRIGRPRKPMVPPDTQRGASAILATAENGLKVPGQSDTQRCVTFLPIPTTSHPIIPVVQSHQPSSPAVPGLVDHPVQPPTMVEDHPVQPPTMGGLGCKPPEGKSPGVAGVCCFWINAAGPAPATAPAPPPVGPAPATTAPAGTAERLAPLPARPAILLTHAQQLVLAMLQPEVQEALLTDLASRTVTSQQEFLNSLVALSPSVPPPGMAPARPPPPPPWPQFLPHPSFEHRTGPDHPAAPVAPGSAMEVVNAQFCGMPVRETIELAPPGTPEDQMISCIIPDWAGGILKILNQIDGFLGDETNPVSADDVGRLMLWAEHSNPGVKMTRQNLLEYAEWRSFGADSMAKDEQWPITCTFRAFLRFWPAILKRMRHLEFGRQAIRFGSSIRLASDPAGTLKSLATNVAVEMFDDLSRCGMLRLGPLQDPASRLLFPGGQTSANWTAEAKLGHFPFVCRLAEVRARMDIIHNYRHPGDPDAQRTEIEEQRQKSLAWSIARMATSVSQGETWIELQSGPDFELCRTWANASALNAGVATTLGWHQRYNLFASEEVLKRFAVEWKNVIKPRLTAWLAAAVHYDVPAVWEVQDCKAITDLLRRHEQQTIAAKGG